MIRFARTQLASLARAAEAAYPEECCGLLLGREDGRGGIVVARLVPSANLAADRRRRFEIDPAVLARHWRGAPEAGAERLVGLYHSHPEGRAAPSAADAASAWEAGWLWLIVPVAAGRAGAAAAWRLAAAGGPFEPVPIEIG